MTLIPFQCRLVHNLPHIDHSLLHQFAAVAVAAVDIVAAAAVITKTDIFADTLAVVHSG